MFITESRNLQARDFMFYRYFLLVTAAPLCYIFDRPVELFYVFRQLYSR